MNLRIATYPSPFLANCCKALGVSAFGAVTPPCKSLIYNALCSAGCFLARIFFCLTQTPQKTQKRTCYRSCLPPGCMHSAKPTSCEPLRCSQFCESLRFLRAPKTLREKKQFKFSLNSVDKMKTTDYADYSD